MGSSSNHAEKEGRRFAPEQQKDATRQDDQKDSCGEAVSRQEVAQDASCPKLKPVRGRAGFREGLARWLEEKEAPAGEAVVQELLVHVKVEFSCTHSPYAHLANISPCTHGLYA